MVLQATGDWLMSMLPDDPESTILKRLKRPKPEEDEPMRRRTAPALERRPRRYSRLWTADRSGMQKLIEAIAR